MNILYMGYWGANEGLSKATIYPHLKFLCDHPLVTSVEYISMERKSERSFQVPEYAKLTHHPFYIEPFSLRLFNKIFSFIVVRKKALRVAKEKRINLVICRSALAGTVGYHLNRKLKLPYVVESFEPHNEYMVESGIWRAGGMSDFIYKRWHKAQIRTAWFLFPAAENYRKRLLDEGISEEKLKAVPCAVDATQFKFDPEKRNQIRGELNISDKTIVGIYVGKFGGIYYEEEAFLLFKKAFRFYQDFHLIILTAQSDEAKELSALYLKDVNTTVMNVDHLAVPNYLSAADFAFAIYKPGEAKKYLSPIKVGEYWANGLPVLLPKGVGDDSSVIEQERAGATFEWGASDIQSAFGKIKQLLNHRDSISALATKYRSFEVVKEVYNVLINQLN